MLEKRLCLSDVFAYKRKLMRTYLIIFRNLYNFRIYT